MSKKKKEWKTEKDRLLGLGVEERRKDYRGNHVPIDKIPRWLNHDSNTASEKDQRQSMASKVSLYKGDITTLEVDAIVNAANSTLLGGGGVDGCIHKAAGHLLVEECSSLNGCETGNAKMTCGYDLPAKYVIHTVGPIARGNVGQTQRDDLESCYRSSLKLVKDNSLRSVAFPCISTGIYGFPNEPAAEIALKTVREWILSNRDEIDLVIFCVFLETDYEIYKRKMSDFFSPDKEIQDQDDDAKMEDVDMQRDEEDASTCVDKKDVDMMSQTGLDDAEMESQIQDGDSQDDPVLPTDSENVQELNESKITPVKKAMDEKAAVKEKEEVEEADGDTKPADKENVDIPGNMPASGNDEETNQEKETIQDTSAKGGILVNDQGAVFECETTSAETSSSTKVVEKKAEDESSDEPISSPADNSQSKDGQVDKRKE